MKKFLLSVAVMAMGVNLLTGCSDEDSKDIPPSDAEVVITKGVFVINNGSSYQSIDGSLTYFDLTSSTVDQDIYKLANGKSLGETPNDVIVYGQKVYVVGSDENTIFVLDVRNGRELKLVSTTDLLGAEGGRTPRRIAAYDGQVYFTTYSGYVAAIDTINFALQSKYQVGSAPEGLTFGNNSSNSGTLYVANSDYGYGNGSISKIDVSTGNATEIKNDKVKNPQEIVVVGDVLYVLDWGHYSDDWARQLDAGVYMISGNDAQLVVPNATGMAVADNMIYTFNDPWGGAGATYSVYDIRSNSTLPLNLSGDSAHQLISPCAISVDQNTGYIFIASRELDPDTGYPSYVLPGFVNIYNKSGMDNNYGMFMGSLQAGVEPHKIEPYHGTAKIKIMY